MGRFRMQREDIILRQALAEGEFRGMYRFEERGGLSIRGQIAGARASDNDLVQLFEDVSNAIEVAAIQITDEELQNNRRNPRNADYPFRRFGRSATRTYRKGFRTSVNRQIGRPGVKIRNVAQSAEYAEFGNSEDGEYIRSRGGKFMKVPLVAGIGGRLYGAGSPTKFSSIRRVRQQEAYRLGFKRDWVRTMDRRSLPILILRDSSGYWWLTPKVRSFEGYHILERALLIGFVNGLRHFRQRK